MREGVKIEEKSGPDDHVTAADCALSQLLMKSLGERFPNDKIVSEEEDAKEGLTNRVWLIDPIDGTDNYIRNDGQWSVMIGLLVDLKPVFGWVFAPANMTNYFGGPVYGAWKQQFKSEPVRFEPLPRLDENADARVIMGYRDRKSHPWVTKHPKVTMVKTGSIGLKVAKVLEKDADIFVHLSAKLKTWDTAGPAAVALGGGLDCGSLDNDELIFPGQSVLHETTVIMGRPGSLAWTRKYFSPTMQSTI
jgi:3'(2'), 5'-bisphosphate nucleotidase